jgi:TRAP-type uncharacterized transport system fused permease subunit
MSDTRGADLGTAPPKHEGAAAESPEQTAESVDDQPIKIEVDDEERPARVLSGLPERMVATVAFAFAILVLWQVFRPLPQGSQYYLMVFLAGTLPPVFIAYRSGLRWLDRGDGPGVLDWVLAAVTLVVCVYPMLPVAIGSGGFYGTPLDVAATYIVLFTLYCAVLEFSGAAQFFVDLSVAAFRRSRTAAGRTTVASGFLLGTVSGSGTATAVTVGAVTWPILRKAGYPPEQAGGMLAAAGVGAILSPPTLGVAAFIVAEYLDVSYVTFGYHFLSLIVIVVLLLIGVSATRAVVYATALAFVLAFFDSRTRAQVRSPRKVFQALGSGVRSALPVVAVCTSAGVITAMTTKTGLGGQLASVLVRAATTLSDNHTVVLACTVVFAAIALALLGLAVPVTASFIIGWAIIGPALLALELPAPAAAMFVFYYSVLSEVTPPTTLAAVGAATIIGARTVPTMWQALKYALPAFLVPIVFVLTGAGEYLLGHGPVLGVLCTTVIACVGVAALAAATGGWILGVGPARPLAPVLAAVGGLVLLYLEPGAIVAGLVALATAVGVTLFSRRRAT